MAVSWTRHRFSGGALALDTTNTVVLRGDVERSFDRFADPAEIARFAAAASGFRADELKGRALAAPDPHAIAGTVMAIRETTDRLMRRNVVDGVLDTADLPDFLNACADGLAGSRESLGAAAPFGSAPEPLAFEAALAVSALSLLSASTMSRLRICPNCNWLFVDRSRNGSRLWCDMAVCGNRQKAKRHYSRRKEEVANG
ncbi:putative RNA-binding Zn ribbon-like protein [Aminobacter lissarensis]|uniref:RNA-binding Zn ribbon-like protein n=1 Tax=Aminobacter carboxidus TaxID=376165 RepID=A0A8E2BF08_9HYPH|nr:CGNR zinc finger domain-containing protein [Aminobacter lissarensis]MBB6468247.1 putative RNA-binding Zn ribbon-like protein [Aminobacter lissarensis]